MSSLAKDHTCKSDLVQSILNQQSSCIQMKIKTNVKIEIKIKLNFSN